MPAKLSEAVVKQRLQELRNLKRLYQQAKLREAAKDVRIAELEAVVASQQARLDTQAIQIAELQTMVFGKKRQPPFGTPTQNLSLPTEPKLPRTKESYRRPLPPASAITQTTSVPVDHCSHCGGELGTITLHNRYEEDIPLPELTPGYVPKLITNYTIQRGICRTCSKPTSGRDLGGSQVSLGPNIRLLICHLVSVAGMSYDQVSSLCATLYGVSVTDGEIAGILAAQHQGWLPAYGQLKADIQASPVVHADETPWPIQGEEGRGYAWALCDALSPRVYFALASTRGAVHARTLFGEGFSGVRISDDYHPYRSTTLPGSQQLCWAHLYWCIRDLRYNANLPAEQLPDVAKWYEAFCTLYQDLRRYLAEPYHEQARMAQTETLWQRVQVLASEPPPDRVDEPVKLTKLKAQLLRAGRDRLFICLSKDTPCDNNRAERDLRQLVLKRKRSFGSQTLTGATVLSTILSLCVTTWRMNPGNYFQALAAL
jgi:transposase